MAAPHLDDVDRALISELVADGRASYAKMAPAVQLSQASVRTRVQRLFDEHIIVVTGRVDPASFGLGIFGFALLEVSGRVDDVAMQVGEVEEAVFVAIGAGRFDIVVELRCLDSDRLLDALDKIRILDGVRRLQSTTVLHYEKQDWTGIGNRKAVAAKQPARALAHELDDVDRELMRQLMADGRATYAALAPLVGLSQAAVRDRVIELLESNTITIQAHPVPEASGVGGFAGIVAKVTGPVGPVARAMAKMAETCLVARTLGRYDILAEVWFEDEDHLAQILDRLRSQSGMGSVDTLPYLRIALEEFQPRTRS